MEKPPTEAPHDETHEVTPQQPPITRSAVSLHVQDGKQGNFTFAARLPLLPSKSDPLGRSVFSACAVIQDAYARGHDMIGAADWKGEVERVILRCSSNAPYRVVVTHQHASTPDHNVGRVVEPLSAMSPIELAAKEALLCDLLSARDVDAGAECRMKSETSISGKYKVQIVNGLPVDDIVIQLVPPSGEFQDGATVCIYLTVVWTSGWEPLRAGKLTIAATDFDQGRQTGRNVTKGPIRVAKEEVQKSASRAKTKPVGKLPKSKAQSKGAKPSVKAAQKAAKGRK